MSFCGSGIASIHDHVERQYTSSVGEGNMVHDYFKSGLMLWNDAMTRRMWQQSSSYAAALLRK